MKTIKKKDSYFRLKVNFAPNKEVYTRNRIKDVMGWLHSSILGKNNQYHDTFSNYSVSDMLGGRLINGVLQYPEGGHVYISSIDNEFIGKIISGCYAKPTHIRDMKCLGCHPETVEVHSDYDIVYSETPILLKIPENGKYKFITVKDDCFVKLLQEKCRKKLINNGLNERIANTLVIEPFHFDNAKVRRIFVGKGGYNLVSVCKLLIRGDSRARSMLYTLGIGTSTGCGFGCVRVNNLNNAK